MVGGGQVPDVLGGGGGADDEGGLLHVPLQLAEDLQDLGALYTPTTDIRTGLFNFAYFCQIICMYCARPLGPLCPPPPNNIHTGGRELQNLWVHIPKATGDPL